MVVANDTIAAVAVGPVHAVQPPSSQSTVSADELLPVPDDLEDEQPTEPTTEAATSAKDPKMPKTATVRSIGKHRPFRLQNLAERSRLRVSNEAPSGPPGGQACVPPGQSMGIAPHASVRGRRRAAAASNARTGVATTW